MTAIAIILFILLTFFWFTYNKSRVAFNKATLASYRSVEEHNKSIIAIESLKIAYENELKANRELIKSLSELYEATAKEHVKTRILLLEAKSNNSNGSGDLFYKIEDLAALLTSGEIDMYRYYSEVNTLLDTEYLNIKT